MRGTKVVVCPKCKIQYYYKCWIALEKRPQPTYNGDKFHIVTCPNCNFMEKVKKGSLDLEWEWGTILHPVEEQDCNECVDRFKCWTE